MEGFKYSQNPGNTFWILLEGDFGPHRFLWGVPLEVFSFGVEAYALEIWEGSKRWPTAGLNGSNVFLPSLGLASVFFWGSGGRAPVFLSLEARKNGGPGVVGMF